MANKTTYQHMVVLKFKHTLPDIVIVGSTLVCARTLVNLQLIAPLIYLIWTLLDHRSTVTKPNNKHFDHPRREYKLFFLRMAESKGNSYIYRTTQGYQLNQSTESRVLRLMKCQTHQQHKCPNIEIEI